MWDKVKIIFKNRFFIGVASIILGGFMFSGTTRINELEEMIIDYTLDIEYKDNKIAELEEREYEILKDKESEAEPQVVMKDEELETSEVETKKGKEEMNNERENIEEEPYKEAGIKNELTKEEAEKIFIEKMNVNVNTERVHSFISQGRELNGIKYYFMTLEPGNAAAAHFVSAKDGSIIDRSKALYEKINNGNRIDLID